MSLRGRGLNYNSVPPAFEFQAAVALAAVVRAKTLVQKRNKTVALAVTWVPLRWMHARVVYDCCRRSDRAAAAASSERQAARNAPWIPPALEQLALFHRGLAPRPTTRQTRQAEVIPATAEAFGQVPCHLLLHHLLGVVEQTRRGAT